MADLWASINDPLFFLHHAQLDKIWWEWQNKSNNLWTIGGPQYPNGDGTIDYYWPLNMSPFTAPDIMIGNVIDTLNRDGSGILCYTYQNDGHESR
jgi:tyrosinase